MMKLGSALLGVALTVFLSPAALAEPEEVMLKNGLTGRAEVVETTPDSITATFSKAGTKGKATLRATELDPHSFYEIRRKHMESTAENHVRLAVFCAEQGMFNRAKYQMQVARAIDPEVDQKLETPKVKELIADRLAAAAKEHYKAGRLEVAYELASLIATKLSDTKWGDKANEVLEPLEKEIAAQAAAEVEKRAKKAKAKSDLAEEKVHVAREAVLNPLERDLANHRKTNSKALREKNSSNSKRGFESAADGYVGLTKKIEQAKAKHEGDAELTASLGRIDAQARDGAVAAYINAGNVDLARGNYTGAQKYAESAMAVDPDSQRANAFQNAVWTAIQMKDDIDVRYRRGRR